MHSPTVQSLTLRQPGPPGTSGRAAPSGTTPYEVQPFPSLGTALACLGTGLPPCSSRPWPPPALGSVLCCGFRKTLLSRMSPAQGCAEGLGDRVPPDCPVQTPQSQGVGPAALKRHRDMAAGKRASPSGSSASTQTPCPRQEKRKQSLGHKVTHTGTKDVNSEPAWGGTAERGPLDG